MLQLKYREVAQANIDQFDRLGAFNGETECQYHYLRDDEVTNICCAIGIMDAKNELLRDNEIPIRTLLSARSKRVTADNPDRIVFIQALHDYRTGHCNDDSFITATQNYGMDNGALVPNPVLIPDCVLDLVKGIRKPEDLTPELYKEVMARLAAE